MEITIEIGERLEGIMVAVIAVILLLRITKIVDQAIKSLK